MFYDFISITVTLLLSPPSLSLLPLASVSLSPSLSQFLLLHQGGGVAEWLRVVDLGSGFEIRHGGPWFKSFTLPLSGFLLSSPEFNSSTARSVKSQLINLPLNNFCSISNVYFFTYSASY